MKDTSEVVACVYDYGSFISLAETLSEQMSKVYIYTPFEQEFQDIKTCIKGDGIENVERIDEPLDPEHYDEIDLFVFPDIGYGGLQRFLRREGKAVWGAMGGDDLELYRTRFIQVLKELGLPLVKSTKIRGITKLGEHLKNVKDKWVKINRYRECMETWHHSDYVHSQRVLETMAVTFGPLKEEVLFVVQDSIDCDIEIGYDGWTVDGKFPKRSFQGYEKKNELYLGALLDYDKLPQAILDVNEKFSKVLAEYGYRNFFASEIRVKDDVPYFIDPTMRMPGQTGEQLLVTCSNLPSVIWHGANGELIDPEFTHKFAVEATMHYSGAVKGVDFWKTIRLPDAVKPWVKLYHYCELDDAFHFPPRKTDELGVLIGVGDTIEEAIDHLKSNLEELSNEPIHIDLNSFSDLLKEVHNAEEQGVKFTDEEIPAPETVLANGD